MNEDLVQFQLTCANGVHPAPALVGVKAHGRLDAVLFELTLRQTYRNTGAHALEVVYTFPLPATAVLLGFASELNGSRQEGVVVGRRQAVQQYEQALAHGDAPVMLEAHASGLHTANIGNLEPGDEMIVECRFAQVLPFEQGRVRLSIPMTIAPRYGQPARAGLEPQQVPTASLAPEYPLSLTVEFGPALAGATLDCPTHRFEVRSDDSPTRRLTLADGAVLDRDVVITAAPAEPFPSLLVRARDAFYAKAPVVMMAALQPLAQSPRTCIALKLLVDCSGSMAGDSLASARTALHAVLDQLGSDDTVGLSRFGSEVVHDVPLVNASRDMVAMTRAAIDKMQADLGGTEMRGALQAVLALPLMGPEPRPDVLLITDGQIWAASELAATARASGQRIFAIGVGSAPAEGVLRELAETSGGACELVTPGEALQAAVARMLHRMRQPTPTQARVDWGTTPAWRVEPRGSVFGGDTVIAFAGFDRPIDGALVRLLVDTDQGEVVELARADADAPAQGDAVARLAASRRIAFQEPDSMEIALRYQLVSPWTNCVLVHRRADEDRSTEPAVLARVESMLAAGWGGTGTVQFASRATEATLACHFSMSYDVRPAAVPTRACILSSEATMAQMAREVLQHLRAGGSVGHLAARGERLMLHYRARTALHAIRALGADNDKAWVLLALWINTRPNGLGNAELTTLLEPLVRPMAPGLVTAALQACAQHLESCAINDWTISPQ